MAITYRGERFSGFNKPKRTPGHKTKSHAVLAKVWRNQLNLYALVNKALAVLVRILRVRKTRLEEDHSKQDTLRTLQKVNCQPLIGLIK
jgi:hypothetical protein